MEAVEVANSGLAKVLLPRERAREASKKSRLKVENLPVRRRLKLTRGEGQLLPLDLPWEGPPWPLEPLGPGEGLRENQANGEAWQPGQRRRGMEMPGVKRSGKKRPGRARVVLIREPLPLTEEEGSEVRRTLTHRGGNLPPTSLGSLSTMLMRGLVWKTPLFGS